MNLPALLLSVLALVILLISVSIYFSSLLKNKVPEIPTQLTNSLIIAILVASYSLYLAIPNTLLLVLPVAVPAVITVFLSSFLLYLLSKRKTPVGDLKVNVGDHFLSFDALTNSNTPYTANDFLGKRTLLKFYRGSWCLYCTRELMMFNEMKPIFDQFNVNVVGISGDNVEQAQAHIERDSLHFTLLADPELNVVKQYGVEHHKGLGADSKNIMTILGMPLPAITQLKFKAMAIPTSLLIDEKGIIQWIDQSTDYRIRASKERIIGALENNFK